MFNILCISVLLLSLVITSTTSLSLIAIDSKSINTAKEIYPRQLVETGPVSNPLDYFIAVNPYYTLNTAEISLTNQTQGDGYLIIDPSKENIQYHVLSIDQDGSLQFTNRKTHVRYVYITIRPSSIENATSMTFTPYLIKGEAPNIHTGSAVGISIGTFVFMLIATITTVVILLCLRKKKTNEVQSNENLTLVDNQL